MLSVIIVGINGWEQYTRPLIADIWKWHPDLELCVIDNASEEPYPQKGIHVHRLDKRVSYAEAINYGFSHTTGEWMLSLNNDVRCNDAFLHLVEPLDRGHIYSRQIITESGHTWFGNWLLLVDRATNWKIGGFDVNFEVCGFEDADYAVRAKELGIETRPIDLPFTHLWGKTRWDIPGYAATREKNMAYFSEKHGYWLGENMVVIHD